MELGPQAMPAPTSAKLAADSYSVWGTPWRVRPMLRVRPARPPPMMAMWGGVEGEGDGVGIVAWSGEGRGGREGEREGG